MEKETRSWWALRGLHEKQSYLFHVDFLIEEDEPGVFSAVCIGMEDTMTAGGDTPEEACANAKLLFMATVDDCLQSGTSVSFAIGNQDYRLLSVGLSEAATVFAVIDRLENEENTDDWIGIPPSKIASNLGVAER